MFSRGGHVVKLANLICLLGIQGGGCCCCLSLPAAPLMPDYSNSNSVHWTYEERREQEVLDDNIPVGRLPVPFHDNVPVVAGIDESSLDADGIRLTLDLLANSSALKLLKTELPGTINLSSSHQMKLCSERDAYGRRLHMLVSGGTNADRWRLWIHSSCKSGLLHNLKRKEGSTTLSRFFIGHDQSDILCKSPGTIDRDTLLRALKLSTRYVMLETFGDKAPLQDYMERMKVLEDMQVLLVRVATVG